jgi:hypothetical protein
MRLIGRDAHRPDMASRREGLVGPGRSSRLKVREQGLRPIQIWVPDVRATAFRSEAHRQSLAVAVSVQAQEDQAFIDTVSFWGDE